MEAAEGTDAAVPQRWELILEGLDCAHCAALIETDVNQIEGVESVSLNFLTKTLAFGLNDTISSDTALKGIRGVVHRHEPGVVVREKRDSPNTVRSYHLIGLDCANCAAKMEEQISRLPGVQSAAVEFATTRLTLGVGDAHEWGRIETEAAAIIRSIEPETAMAAEAGGKASPAEDAEQAAAQKREILRLVGGAVLYAAAFLPVWSGQVKFAWFLAAYLLAGGEVIWRALRNIVRGQVFDENFLMTVASAGAFAVGEFPEGVAVMLFYQVGELLQDMAVEHSRRSIRALLDIRPDAANLKVGNEIRVVAPETVMPGELIIIKPGEKVPLDGEILEGSSYMDTSALTGESVPREVVAGDGVLGGFINQSGLLTVRVTKPYGESAVARILDLVQNASSRKAPTENFITRFARYYTPTVVLTALAIAVIPPLFVPGALAADWIYRGLIFLVISCPCALVVSIPLGFFGGIGGASRNGVLIKGSNYLEALNAVDIVVFDKTGTLTKGVFQVREVVPWGGFTAAEVLSVAALAESYSNHPIARSILEAYGQAPDQNEVEKYSELPGQGIRLRTGDREVLVGNGRLLTADGIAFEVPDTAGTVVQVAVGGQYAGYIRIADEVKSDAAAAIQALKRLGVKQTVLLTGDSRKAGAQVAEQLGIDLVYAELLPEGKVDALEQIESQQSPGRKVVFVGDGINDAPVLARADIGVAMGGLGSAAAIEAADVVLMTDEPMKLVSAIRIARRTRAIVWQNIVFALGVKGLVLLLGAGGIATMWEAVFADVGVALLAVLNAMRVMNSKNI